jgi:hypothetical protein
LWTIIVHKCSGLIYYDASEKVLSSTLSSATTYMSKKRTTTKSDSLPRKKAKVGAYFSGISRSAAGEVDIGSMVGLTSATSTPLRVSNILAHDKTSQDDSGIVNTPSSTHAVQTSAPDPPSPDVTVGTFCHFCCDQATSPRKHECIDCGTIVCEQFLPRSSGCIYLNTVEVGENDFRCPACSRKGDGRDKPLRYAFIGFGRRKKAKTAWPMTIVNLTLESMKDEYLARSVILEAENHFRFFEDNVSTVNIIAAQESDA